MYKDVQAEKGSPQRYTSRNATKRLIKEHSDLTLRKQSIPVTQTLLYQIGKQLVQEAENAARHDDRKTLHPEDFVLAAKHRFKTKMPDNQDNF